MAGTKGHSGGARPNTERKGPGRIQRLEPILEQIDDRLEPKLDERLNTLEQLARGGMQTLTERWELAGTLFIAACRRYPDLKCLLLRKVGKANKENFQDVRRRILRRLPHRYNSNDATLTFPNGSQIVLGHFQHEGNLDAYLGLEYDAIGVEEATTLSHAKYRAIQTCCRTSKPDWRPRIYSTTNPGGIMVPFTAPEKSIYGAAFGKASPRSGPKTPFVFYY